MELKQGYMTNAELAEWFGIQVNSFRARKEKKLEELKNFADFKVVDSKKVYIIKVYKPVYVKKKSNDYTIVKEEFTQVYNDSKIDTASNVSKKIYNKRKSDLTIKESTTYEYTRAARNELYGKPFVGCGEKGVCRYIWAKQIGEGQYERFNDTEQAIYKRLLVKYFKGADEKTIFVRDMIKRGEITEEEAWGVYEDMMNLEQGFMNFKIEMEEAIGYPIVRVTEIEDQINWW